jgi:hypothetical protein
MATAKVFLKDVMDGMMEMDVTLMGKTTFDIFTPLGVAAAGVKWEMKQLLHIAHST